MAYCGSPVQLVLTFGAFSLDLMDERNGFRVASVDFAFPEVREILSALDTRDGSFDMTQFLGPRVVTIAGSVVPTAYASRSRALDVLAPFLDPAARPVLTYQIDPDEGPRTIGLRAAALSAPFTNPTMSAFTASWKATNPLSYSASQSRVSGILPGGSATLIDAGTFRAWPVFRIHGPCTDPVVQIGGLVSRQFAMVLTTIAAGAYFDCDMGARTVVDNTGASQFNLVKFVDTTWPPLLVGANVTTFSPATSSAGAALDVSWYDAWLL